MSGEIIRMGDKTSHGGTVLEGSQADICMGKPIAFVGHKTQCPKCKGIFPIIEGVTTTTFYGKGVAVAGMKTACGAVLVASQFTDIVEWGSGASSSGRAGAGGASSSASSATGAGKGANTAAPAGSTADETEIEHFFALTDESGVPPDGYRYDLHVGGKLHTKGGSYASGETVKIDGDESARLVTWLSRDGGSRS